MVMLADSFSSAGSFDVAPSDRDYLFDLLNSGHGYLALRLGNGTSIMVPLVVASYEDWHRPDCG